MKKYFELKVPIPNSGGMSGEMIIARLSEVGFEGFVEEEDHLLAYIIKDKSKQSILSILEELNIIADDINLIVDRNWNAEWESDYSPVIIDDKVMVRAPFHDPPDVMDHDIVIEPKMSFGTAHHETTHMMISLLVNTEIKGKRVLDMGCGTAVLAILAAQKGAKSILAVDNDEWAYNNSLENVALNHQEDIEVMLDDAGSLKNRKFDIIIANINRNILMNDIPVYASVLDIGGQLLLSGFYESDLEKINEKCQAHCLNIKGTTSRNNWIAAVYTKS